MYSGKKIGYIRLFLIATRIPQPCDYSRKSRRNTSRLYSLVITLFFCWSSIYVYIYREKLRNLDPDNIYKYAGWAGRLRDLTKRKCAVCLSQPYEMST